MEAFLELDSYMLALLKPLGFLSSCQRTKSLHWSRNAKEGLYMVPVEAILSPLVWTASKAGVVTTLLPPHYSALIGQKLQGPTWSFKLYGE